MTAALGCSARVNVLPVRNWWQKRVRKRQKAHRRRGCICFETQPEEAQVQTAPAEEVPEGVIMEQCVLGISYTTPVSGWLSSPFGYQGASY